MPLHEEKRSADAFCQTQGCAPYVGPPRVLGGSPPSWSEPWTWRVRARLRGWLEQARRVAGLAPPRAAHDARPAARERFPADDLQPGDLVRVRDAEYIRRTLDQDGKYLGCKFTLGMWDYCGRELRVVRRVNRFFDEAQWRMLHSRNMVLLEGAYCQGAGLEDGPCERMCFFFWRSEWLEKIG